MSKYKKDFEISYFTTDKHKRLRPVALLNLMTETSGEHSNFIIKIDKLEESSYAWMLNRWKVRIDKYPKAKDKITIETWTSNIDRFYAKREFLVYDEKGDIIAKASSLWIFVDIIKKRPVRIPSEILESYKAVNEYSFDDFNDFKEELSIGNYFDFHVRRADIDYNNHVNNTVYLNWMLEVVPEEIYENFLLREFEIIYKKESKYGDIILSGIKEMNNNNDHITFYHNIKNKKTDIVHASGISLWEK